MKKEPGAKKLLDSVAGWKGDKDMDEICRIFSTYLTNRTVRTSQLINEGKLEKDGVTETKEAREAREKKKTESDE